MKNEKCLTSIIIPVYNNESSIEKCLHSMLNQTYSNLELVIIDDGSTDNSLQIIKMVTKTFSNSVVITQENKGVSAARNTGIEKARGKYIMFADGDDEILPDMIENYVCEAEKNSADVVIGGIIFLRNGERKVVLPPDEKYSPEIPIKYLAEGHRGIFGHVPNKMYRRSFLNENNLRFPTSISVQEDLLFALSAYDVARTIRQIQYAGYLYNMPEKAKEISLRVLLENRIEIGRVALRHQVDVRPLIPRINHIVYSLLFAARDYEEIRNVLSKADVLEWIDYNLAKDKEERLILFFAYYRWIHALGLYFSIRRKIKSVIK